MRQAAFFELSTSREREKQKEAVDVKTVYSCSNGRESTNSFQNCSTALKVNVNLFIFLFKKKKNVSLQRIIMIILTLWNEIRITSGCGAIGKLTMKRLSTITPLHVRLHHVTHSVLFLT